MKVFEQAIATARTYLGKTEVTENAAPWLSDLMKLSGNPCQWTTPEPYCISAACACFAIALKSIGKAFPKYIATPSTQTFYEKAMQMGWTDRAPRVGAIVIFRSGYSWHGHAEIVTAVSIDGLDTIGFNTSGHADGDQRNGEGVYIKRRNFAAFQKSDTKLWIRGYVFNPEWDLEIPVPVASVANVANVASVATSIDETQMPSMSV